MICAPLWWRLYVFNKNNNFCFWDTVYLQIVSSTFHWRLSDSWLQSVITPCPPTLRVPVRHRKPIDSDATRLHCRGSSLLGSTVNGRESLISRHTCTSVRNEMYDIIGSVIYIPYHGRLETPDATRCFVSQIIENDTNGVRRN